MLKIDSNNNITITQGDTLTLALNLTKDGEAYEPVEGDVIRFAAASGYVDDPGYELLIEEQVPTDTLTFTISAANMSKLSRSKSYNYDVEITHGDGTVDTVISAQIKLMGEVK